MTETPSRLEWRPTAYSGHRGYAGGLELFGIYYRTNRADPTYQMRCQLPDRSAHVWKHDNLDRLKVSAERILDEWLAKVNGQPIYQPADLADQAIGLFLEYRDTHGHDEPSARAAAVLEVAEGASVTPAELGEGG